MTIEVTVHKTVHNNQKVVTNAPPIAAKFIGQRFGRLIAWMQKQGGFEMREL